MKSSVLLAAALLGCVDAGVHKLKMKKVSLSDQLVSISVVVLMIILSVILG